VGTVGLPDLPKRSSLVWCRRVCAVLEVIIYIILGFKSAWLAMAAAFAVGALRQLEDAAKVDIARIDAAKRSKVEYDFTRGTE
jgi:hypothetical protein